MLNLILFKSPQGLVGPQLSEFMSDESLHIAPGPKQVDLVRERMKSQNCLSIAQWSQELLEQVSDQPRERKSVLLKHLSTLWKIECQRNSKAIRYGEFEKAFKVFTELKSYTNEKDLFLSLVEELEEFESQFFAKSYLYLEEVGFIDEYKIFSILKENSYKLEFTHDTFFFWNFKFFNPLQIDFFQEIAREKEIFLIFPKFAYERANDLDWVKWIKFDNIFEFEEEKNQKIKICKADFNYLNKVLRKSEIKDYTPYYLGQAVGPEKILETIALNVNCKVNYDFFEASTEEVFNELEKAEEITNVLLDNCIKRCVMERQFSKLKVYLQLKEELEDFQGLSEVNSEISLFDRYVLRNLVNLNLPRVNLISSIPNTHKVLGVKDDLIYAKFENDLVIVCKDYMTSERNDLPFGYELLKKLAAIGPLKRGELENDYNFSILKAFVDNGKGVLLLDQQLIDDPYSRIHDFITLDGSEVELIESDQKFEIMPDYLIKESPLDAQFIFSASKLQTYIDCPRKFQLQYITKRIEADFYVEELSAIEIGQIEHELIEKAYDKNVEFSQLKKWVVEHLENNIYPSKKLSKIRKIEVNESIYEHVKNGVEFLHNILKNFSDPKVYLEQKIESPGVFRGKIDCVIYDEERLALLDFKRSKASIPSFKNVQEFSNVQLWSYYSRLDQKHTKVLLGYVCLDDLNDSLLVSSEKFGEIKQSTLDIQDFAQNYLAFEDELFNKMKSEVYFSPQPKNLMTCRYCEARSLCPKGEVNE